MDVDRSSRTVIVTGAGGVLGRAMVHRVLRDGFRCVAADREQTALEETLQLAGPAADRATPITCDIRVPEERNRLIRSAITDGSILYGLVNNAGIARLRPLLDETLEDWRITFETNLEAAYFLSQRAIEHMRTQREGRIVNIASMHGIVGVSNKGKGARAPEETPGDRGPVRETAYATSKGGLIQLTRDLAAAVGRWGITVNAVSPGNVPHPESTHDRKQPQLVESAGAEVTQTPGLGDRIDPEILDALASQTPLQRLGKVEEIAGPVCFLLSPDASYITGANLVVDGGFTIW